MVDYTIVVKTPGCVVSLGRLSQSNVNFLARERTLTPGHKALRFLLTHQASPHPGPLSRLLVLVPVTAGQYGLSLAKYGQNIDVFHSFCGKGCLLAFS